MSHDRSFDPSHDPERRMSTFTKAELEERGQLRLPLGEEVIGDPRERGWVTESDESLQEALHETVARVSRAAVPEPKPEENWLGRPVEPIVLRNLMAREGAAFLTPTTTRLYKDIVARTEMGFKKYGVRLTTHNGRNAVVDLYQEVLDGIQYVSQAQAEQPEWCRQLWLDVLIDLGKNIGEYIHAHHLSVGADDDSRPA